MHFSGCRVHSPEIEFSPNPFRSTSFKDDLGKKILGASICQIVNRAIRLGEDIHLFFLLISRKCLLPYVGMRDILIRRTPHTPVLTRLEFWFLTICCIISLFLNILVKFFQTFCDLSKIFSVGFEFTFMCQIQPGAYLPIQDQVPAYKNDKSKWHVCGAIF